MSPFRLIFGAVLVGGAAYVFWVAAGSRLVAVLDRLTTAFDSMRPRPEWYAIDSGEGASFMIESRRWEIPSTWRVTEAPVRHVTLEVPQGRITLGSILRASSLGGGRTSYEFTPDSGDEVLLTRRRSRVWWPTPMAFSLLTGNRLASAERYVYDHIVWRKPNGEELEIVWRDKQRYLANNGWQDQLIPTTPTVTLRPGK